MEQIRNNVLLLIPVSFLLTAASGWSETTAEKPGPVFTVATYNINWGNWKLHEKVKVIRQAAADFVLLQETNAESERFIRRKLSRTYPHMVFKTKEAAGGFGFLSKTPLENLRFLEPKHGYFGTFICNVELEGRTVQVISVHLQPVLPRNGEGITALFNMFLKTESARAKEIAFIYEHLKKNKSTIVAGDFNSTVALSAPTFLKSRGFIDSFASVTKNPDQHVTWHWLHNGINWCFRLDYIFHTKNMLTLKSRIIENDCSDHYLLVSTLKWKEKPEESSEQTREPASTKEPQ